ncbi:hypothetical protein BLNAU_5524 [Blattamonas nauphoetae]|uniref:Uncharacterized protein n=1 Tax=Blattamonas nauphoetae TaxID=2049346 RepID=A0ABQ9Y6V0_9EUKA|nr:hypothetical protein BLNAU_5524 [Blattamonas nauphoetae]
MDVFVSSHLVQILIDCDLIPLLKSIIITCLDLLEQPTPESNCPSSDRTDTLFKLLDLSSFCTASCLYDGRESLYPIVESAFSNLPQLCSLLERTSRHTAPTYSSYLRMIINMSATFYHLIPRMLEENLVERMIDTSKPMTVPTRRDRFHLRFIWTIRNLIISPICITKDPKELKTIRMLQFEHVLKPAIPYLQFLLQREEFIPKDNPSDHNLSRGITDLLDLTLELERDLFEDGEIVETGREEWEVGWLVEKTKEKELGERLKRIRQDDVTMKRDKKERWKKRVERQREAGQEDAVEEWLTRRDRRTQSEIVEYLRQVRKESGINKTI